jgi:hypothetical protein
MKKLRYSGDTCNYSNLSLKDLKEILKRNNIAGRSKMTRRYMIIDFLEEHDKLCKNFENNKIND